MNDIRRHNAMPSYVAYCIRAHEARKGNKVIGRIRFGEDARASYTTRRFKPHERPSALIREHLRQINLDADTFEILDPLFDRLEELQALHADAIEALIGIHEIAEEHQSRRSYYGKMLAKAGELASPFVIKGEQ
jgi:hypothetical protein